MIETSNKPSNWYQQDAEQVAQQLQVDLSRGLSATEAKNRLEKFGPNRLAGKKKEPGWQAFLRQYNDFMQIMLVVAAAVSWLVVDDVNTALLLGGLTVFNAVMGLNQESKAEDSLAALSKMLKTIARVRRDAQVLEIDAEELVPGDIVLMEAGNRVPADGRLFLAATLEIEEAALTGESTPVLKNLAAIDQPDLALGDRTCLAYMNTAVTRGRGEMVVTATGMDTEIGKIAVLLNRTVAEKTPLQIQLDGLSKIIAGIAGIALLLIIGLGLARGDDFGVLFAGAVAMAVAAIPTGLPAVVTTMLSLGTRELAGRNAIIKRLPSVETLGSTSAICSDKTGTLTLNKMTARELAVPGAGRFTITGEGYSTQGTIQHTGGMHLDLDPFLLPMALCADARLDGENLIGDPTEGALIVLAAKGGLDLEVTRLAYPRLAEVPFDSDYKFMATFHQMNDEQGKAVVRGFVKGAPDVLVARGSSFWSAGGALLPITDDNRHLALEENERMAKAGERVMVVGRRDFDPQTFDPRGDLVGLVNDLTLLAMVGIVDPPRPEAKAAIAECKDAGIQVRMITGDHAVTAAAIGRELGIQGQAITGAQFAAMSDEQLLKELPEIGVIARVAPEDKIRLVKLLQRKGNIVAMTGDGVNDAPALKAANIGVAMGITGTEVSKEAAVMILTDDNFATIVKAVEYGRNLYDNLLKYIRFQMSTLVAFVGLFLIAAFAGVAGGVPMTPVQILWINFAVDAPIAVALSYALAEPGLMRRKPRPVKAPILNRAQWVRLIVQGAIMVIGVIAVRVSFEPSVGPLVAGTMFLVTLSVFHIIAGLVALSDKETLFRKETVSDSRMIRTYGIVLLLTFLSTELNFMQRIFGTTGLTVNQWLACFAFAASLLVVEEVIRFFRRRKD